MWRNSLVASWALIALPILSFGAEPNLVLLPKTISLSSPEARQTLIVQQQADDQILQQVRSELKLTSSDEKVVRVVDGVAIPVGNGKATITAEANGKTATADAIVSQIDKPFQWSFRNHVESVLSKQGCNGGACHGARAGQKGFRLTLFGFDVDADYTYLTRQAVGRRIVPSDPGRSLILTKPTGLLPHKGGVKLDPASLEYRVIAEWIAAGTPGPRDDDPQISKLEVLPKNSQQTVGTEQQLVVLAHFNDGHVEDVTRWSKYVSTNSSVASVGEHGKVKITGSGEGAVSVWYLNLTEMAYVSSPYPNQVAPATYAREDRNNFIDELVLEKLQSLRIPPSARCDDATFLRRAYLDTIGTLPTLVETQAFLSDASSDKREKLIDHLLGRPEFVDYWTNKWGDLLLLSGERLRPKALETYHNWIRKNVAENKPWDKFVYEIVTATGSTHENGAANFYALHQDPEVMAETVSQAFMGLSINCAKCHNHPLEKWTNDQYYGMANMFSRVRAKGWGGDFRNGDGMRVVYSDTQGELLQPSRGQPQQPRPLDGAAVAFNDSADRRIKLAEWLVSPQNPYFTRAIANRVWANFFGVGLVERVDDLRASNPASNEVLLSATAEYVKENQYDLKQLMRAILQSSTYQRSSQPVTGNEADERFYSRYYPKRLKAEVLLDALSQVSGTPSQFRTMKPDGKPGDAVSAKRALQLPDSFIDSYFLKTFGRPDRLITCDCERSDEPSMTQVFHMLNGETINNKLKAKENAVAQAVEQDNAQVLDQLFLTALCRLPTPAEKERTLKELAETPADERRAVLEDVYWSVLTCREFVFNH
ncbi:hypothetical protein ETAA8_53490 [Anatilimnocola aggregata]|uniref:S-layer protein n=1 Tax=Anatilimnocola aggregata TaxID=2528021 RepID=A0A517YJ27_9BACT|nr:DUF1549 and DUF1553 domain-containing protein [Anatilimnocola aggregata]QDU30230.1 hypothetical protein ETAA8_53490 [Anatilimnocola aggregata]